MSDDVLGFVPARGGSKTVPLKNIVHLKGRALVEYVITAGLNSKSIKQVVCSTDHEDIARICRRAGAEVDIRPKALSCDETPILDVLVDFLKRLEKNIGHLPFAIALLQPTSPFVLPEHIDRCAALLWETRKADSIQTVTTFPHNHHAYNQRLIENGIVRFRFEKERAECYNKQTKPSFYIFGNLVITKTSALLNKLNVFASPSLAFRIPSAYALDVDCADDFETAEWYLQKKKVVLPHMEN